MDDNTFHAVVAVSFVVLAGAFVCALFYLVQTLKSLRRILDDIEDATSGVKLVKSGVSGALSSVLGLVIDNLRRKGGAKNGRRI